MKVPIILTAVLLCVLPQVIAGDDNGLHPLILTVRREFGEPTTRKVVRARLESEILTKWASTKPSELKIPMRGPFLESKEAEDHLNKILRMETPAKDWNYLVGRLEGSGVGPNHSFFTHGRSVLIGKPDTNGNLPISLNCDITGPWMDGTPMTHSIHFVVPRSLLPERTKKIRFKTNVKRVGDTSIDDKIVPPKYPSFIVSLEQTKAAEQGGADQPATAPESKSEGKEKPKPKLGDRSR